MDRFEGWSRRYKRRLSALARGYMHNDGMPWPDALATARDDLRCGARTWAGTPCKIAGRGNGGKCARHGGLSCGPTTAEGRKRISQFAKTRPRFNGRWATKAEIEAMQTTKETSTCST